MDYFFHVPQTTKTMHASSLDFEYSNGFSHRKPFPSEVVKVNSVGHNYSNGFSCRKPSPSEVVEVTSVGQWKPYFDATIVDNKLLVIEFTATWCGPCRFMEPALKEFAAKYTDVDFIKIDVEKLACVARQFMAETLPAFVLVKGGREVDRVAGVKKNELQNKIEIHRYD